MGTAATADSPPDWNVPAHVAEAPGARAKPRAERSPRWTTELSIGHQWIRGSEHQRLLETDGYGPSRLLGLVSGDYVLDAPFAVGAFSGIAWRQDGPEHGGPALSETIALVGVEVPLVLGGGGGYIRIAPRIGYANGRTSLHDGGSAVGALALGGEVSGVFSSHARRGPRVDGGASLGFFIAKSDAPGAFGGRYDLGGIHLSLVVGFGG